MKKNLCKTLALCLVMLMAFSVAASAATISRDTSATDTVTISVAGVGASDEVTLLVVPTGADLASFTFATPTEKFDAYSGFTTMNVADGALSDTDKGDTPDPGADTPTIDAAKTKMYKAAFGLDGFKRIFVKLAEGENGQWMPAHPGEGSTIYYSSEREGYDGLIKSEAADIDVALTELTWNKVAPTDDEIIKQYGNVDGVGSINLLDTAKLGRAIQKKDTFTNKQLLIADVDNSSGLNILDTAQVGRFIQKKITEFAVVSDR